MKKIEFIYEMYDNGEIPSNMSEQDLRSFKSYRKVKNKFPGYKVLMEDKELPWDECVYVQLLIPYDNESYNENENDNSIVMIIDYFDKSFIFMGDCEFECEQKIMDKIDVKANFLKVGHHGDSDATSDEFLDAVDPDFAFISTGNMEKFGHPHDETLEILDNHDIEVLRTDEGGHIIITTDGKDFSIERKEAESGVKEIW